MTILSYSNLEDKLSLVLVPLLASAGIRIIKPVWSDEHAGQDLPSDLISVLGIEVPSNPEEIDKILKKTGGTYATFPSSVPFCDEGDADRVPDRIIRFKRQSVLTLYSVNWDGILVDIRVGDHPNQTPLGTAQELAMDLKVHCNARHTRCSFFFIDQNQPLGHALGPLQELREALDVLRAEGPSDCTKLAIEQGADLLLLVGRFTDRTQAKSFLKEQLQNGFALDRFMKIVRELAAKVPYLDEQNFFPHTQRPIRIVSPKEGYVQQIAMDRVFDLKQRLLSAYKGAGLSLLKKIGDRTTKNDPLAEAFLPPSWDPRFIQNEIQAIYSISDYPPEFQPLILEKINGRFRF